MYRSKKYYPPCLGPGCDRPGDCARGRCSRCYIAMRKACIENGSWGAEDEAIHAALPKWEYENEQGEVELAARTEKQAQEKKSASEPHQNLKGAL
jgi:hypothetical protein